MYESSTMALTNFATFEVAVKATVFAVEVVKSKIDITYLNINI